MKIDILGTEYDVEMKTRREDLKLESCGGYIDPTLKKIVVEVYAAEQDANPVMAVGDMQTDEHRAMRHEIVHGFFYESGLFYDSGYGQDETLVDWIALQMPKMVMAMREADCLY